MQIRTATVDGAPIRWLEQGTGTPVVLVHGIPTGTTVRRIEGGKHFTPEDHPDVIAEEIRSLAAEAAAR